MSGSASIYTEQAVLGHTLAFAPMVMPTRVYVALCLAAQPPSETVQGIEVSASGYVRLPATFALIASPANIAANTTSIEWPPATGAWGTLGYFELWDAAIGGNRLYWGAFAPADTVSVGDGDIVRFSAGSLGVQAASGSGGSASIGAYLPLAGGTMTGPLILAREPQGLSEAATKAYVDGQLGGGAGGPGFLPLSGGTMMGPLVYTATGATTPRAAQDRAGEWVNLEDYGARLDGVTSDATAYAAARTAASSRGGSIGGVIVARANGKQATFAKPTYAAPPVLWKIDGMTFGTAGLTPVTNITSGDLVESYFSGVKYFQRTDAIGAPGSPVLRLDYTGAGSSQGVLNINSTLTDGNNFLANITSILTATGNGDSTGPYGIGSVVRRTNGSCPLWLYWGNLNDSTGLGKGPLGSETAGRYGHVMTELSATQNGPDNAASSFDPHQGGRVGLHVAGANYAPPNWAASHAYALNAPITPGNGYTYYATNAGTSAAAPPTWPIAPPTATVVDGTITWRLGTTVRSGISRMIGVTGDIDIGAALAVADVKIYDAGIELSTCTLDTTRNPNVAGIRLGANMPIDFSGNGTQAGQNLHTLSYTATGTDRLRYMVGATERLAISDNGGLSSPSLPTEVLFYGAVMDGVTSDQTALTNAFNATPAFGTIHIPAGNINPGLFSPTSKMLLWKLDGTYTGSGTTPFSGIGNSVIESFLPTGTKFFAKGSTSNAVAFGPTLRADLSMSHAGGATGTMSAFVANLQSTAGYTGNMGLIGAAITTTNNRTSGGPEVTSLNATAIRPSGGSGAGIYGANIIADDQTLQNSSQSGSAVGMEINTKANGLDDGLSADGFNVPGSASGANIGASRVLLDLKYGRSIRTGAGLATAEWSNIFNIGIVDTDTSWNQAKNYIRLTGKATFSGINMLHLDLTGAQAIAMQTEQSVGWSVAALASVPVAANWRTLQYTSTGTARLRYMVGAIERLTLPDAKPVVSGAKGGNAALASLLAALVAANLVTDSTTA